MTRGFEIEATLSLEEKRQKLKESIANDEKWATIALVRPRACAEREREPTVNLITLAR